LTSATTAAVIASGGGAADIRHAAAAANAMPTKPTVRFYPKPRTRTKEKAIRVVVARTKLVSRIGGKEKGRLPPESRPYPVSVH
jgi:hypothetical protein